MKRPADIYLRFLRLAGALPAPQSSLQPLDPLEERILVLVARATHAHERLSISDLTAKGDLGSRATLHGRLHTMREKGWIRLAETDDARRKQIELTEAAMRYFDKLSEYLVKALKM